MQVALEKISKYFDDKFLSNPKSAILVQDLPDSLSSLTIRNIASDWSRLILVHVISDAKVMGHKL